MTESVRNIDLKSAKVLLVEDTLSLARTYTAYLAGEVYSIDHVETGQAAKEALKSGGYDLVLLDLRLPDISGEEVMTWIKETGIDVSITVITAQGSVGVAVNAMRAGAVDFLMKPFTEERLIESVRYHLEERLFLKSVSAERASDQASNDQRPIKPAKKPAVQQTSSSTEGERDFSGFIGESLPMRAVYRSIESASASNATVFVTGESGTGKEVCANAIHALSNRVEKEFVPLNCAAIPGELMESEIFGHIKGAFTGATTDKIGAAQLADGGTLFLDEICEMALHLQTKLLRFIQTGTFNPVGQPKSVRVNTRFICATNRDPLEEVAAGRFREDLYYRLHVIPISLPPLRDRHEDVLRIGSQLLQEYASEEGKSFQGIADDAKAAMLAYEWPGNVRQLQNIMRNAVVFGEGPELTAEMLRSPVGTAAANAQTTAKAPVPRAVMMSSANTEGSAASGVRPASDDLNALAAAIQPLELVERDAIENAVDLCGGDVRKAAVFLGVSPATIYRKQKMWREKDQ